MIIEAFIAAALECDRYDEVVSDIRSQGLPIMELMEGQLFQMGIPKEITRGFVFFPNGIALMGLEYQDCLLPPVPLGVSRTTVH